MGSRETVGVIGSFSDANRFLSNFFSARTVHEGILYPTSEHAYQAAKTLDRDIREAMAQISRPRRVKQLGKQLQLRPDWPIVRVPTMREVVKAKFEHDNMLGHWLKMTGRKMLIEGNTWHDTFWGVCHCDGQTECPGNGTGFNWLGRILMDQREAMVNEGHDAR